MTKKTFLVTILVLTASFASEVRADVITLWNFNSVVDDGDTATGTTSPATGAGTLSMVGNATNLFASGNSNGGSTDPVVANDTGLGVTTFSSLTELTDGIQFMVSTVGYSSVYVSYDTRHSNSSSRYQALQYTTNGSLWTTAAFFTGTSGDTWFNGRAFDFSAISAANNNANFGVRILSVTELTATGSGSSGFVASNGGTFASSGNWRMDMVSVSGTAIPEPSTWALIGLGLTSVLLFRPRRIRRI